MIYRLAVLFGDVVNALCPVQAASRAERMADALADAEAAEEVWPARASLDDVCCYLEEIRNELRHHQLSARPAPSERNRYASLACPGGCDCSCCYGYPDRDCHCFAYPCNCGGGPKEHGDTSAPPRSDSAGSDGADPPPAAVGRGGGHPTSPDGPSPGWSGEGPGGGDSTAPPGQPDLSWWTTTPKFAPPGEHDRPLSELLAIAATWIQHARFDIEYPVIGDFAVADGLIAELRDTAAQMAAVELEP